MSDEIRPDTHWAKRRRRIRSSAGQWLAGKDAIVRGRSLLFDCFEQLELRQLEVLAITGRTISPRLARWLDKSVFWTSYPDPRIWCNTLAALCGTQAASPISAVAIACLAADSRAYGSYVTHLSAMLQQQLLERERRGEALADIVASFEGLEATAPRPDGSTKPDASGPERGVVPRGIASLSGFARPVRVADERIESARRLMSELGYEAGPQLQLAERLSALLEQRYGLGMNISAFFAAFMLDRGFSPVEIYRLATTRVSIGALACYAECVGEPENSFLPLRCDDIGYVGVPPRTIAR